MERAKDMIGRVATALFHHDMADEETPILLMVSGGSDSTALAYITRELSDQGSLGPLAMLHVNHKLRGQDAEDDAYFVSQLAALLEIPLFLCEIDIAAEARRTGENVEAVARRERYRAAQEALESLCFHTSCACAEGRIFTAHTADDRVESFYMRSIVGTGPGGFRSMRYCNGPIMRPLLDLSRDDLRDYLKQRHISGQSIAQDATGALWREDATNAHTDRFRAYVRHEIVPRAKERNAQLLTVLCRSMNLIADEDDMLDDMAISLVDRYVVWTEHIEGRAPDADAGCTISPAMGAEPLPLKRRAVMHVMQNILGQEARVETASVEAVLAAWIKGGQAQSVQSGYVANVQGDLAISANKKGVLIEPMAAFRARRKGNRL